jgi:hypothetical protein
MPVNDLGVVRGLLRQAAAMLALILCTVTAYAQPVRIPNSEMPGRERYRFVDPPAPKSQPGEWLAPLPSQAYPAPKRRRAPTAKPKR